MQRLFILLFLLFSSVILGDNVSDSLLLSYYDSSILPVMFIVNAAFLFIVSSFFMTLIDRADRGVLLAGIISVHIGMLLTVKIAISHGFGMAYPFLYSYSYASKMVLFMVFWTVVNDIIDARDAKKIFPKIAAGGVLGGITVSFSAALLAGKIGAEGLLVVWIVILALALPVAWSIHRKFLPHLRAIREPASGGSVINRILDFRLLRRDPLLRHMALIYFLTFILLYSHDFIFLSSLKENFLAARSALLNRIDPSLLSSVFSGGDVDALILKREVPTFLGIFKGAANSLTLVIQFTVAGFILRTLGTVRAMLVMPACFVVAYGAVLLGRFSLLPDFAPDGYPFFNNSFFLVVLTGLTARIALFDAVYSPNFQIFFSALNKDIRGRGKILIEGVIKPFAILAAGLFIIFCYRQYTTVSMLLLFVFSIFLVVLCLLMRRSYTQSIARSLGDGREERLREQLYSEGSQEENTLPLLKDFLDDSDPEIADFATSSLAKLSGDEPLRLLWGRFTRADSAGRIRFMRILAPLGDIRYQRLFEAGLYDTDGKVMASSMEALLACHAPIDSGRFTKLLVHPEPAVRAAAAAGLWKKASDNERIMLEAVIRDLLHSPELQSLEAGIRAASASSDNGLWGGAVLFGLNRAVGLGGSFQRLAIEASGSFKDPRACKWLIELSPKINEAFLDSLDKSIAKTIAMYPEIIEESFRNESIITRSAVVRALVITREKPSSSVHLMLEELLGLEVHIMLRYAMYATLLDKEHDGEALLAEAVYEKFVIKSRPHFFLVAAALYPESGLQSAASRINSINRHVRASALELLDSISSLKAVRIFLRLCDKPDPEWIKDTLKREWHDDIPTRYFVLKVLSENENNWIRSLAMYSAIENDRISGSVECLDSIGLNRVSAFARLSEALYG